MGTIHVKEMTGGLDARRLPETTPGGVLIRADNGHITRGGEFESRAAFVPEIELPAGTVGLAHTRTGLVVFGDAVAPVGLPPYVQYQRLQHDGAGLRAIRDWELFGGKLYVVAEFDSGAVVHFYDGVEVAAWEDARARVVVRVVSGAITPAVAASAQFDVTAGVGEVINTVTSILVDGSELLADPIVHTGDNATTAAAIAAEINANPTTPEYLASAVGARVTLTAGREGTQANGRVITWTTTGNFEITAVAGSIFSGGVDEVVPSIDALTVGGVNVIRAPIIWAGTPEATAEALADEITETASDPEYEASVYDNSVVIRATVEGTAQNGLAAAATTTGTITVDYPNGSTTTGGAALATDVNLPADIILTVRERLYAGAGSILHYSAVEGPTYWAPGGTGTGQIGAGFVNVAASNASSYRITGLVRYYDKLAVFTPDTVQTWFIDPDPDLITQSQVLENTGTQCPRSVTQFGDADIFYLDASGLRSLRARDSSNAAATTDVGVPIDDILAAKVAQMTTSDKRNVIGLINPTDKRFWLIMGSEIFIYSYFPSSKVNAWTRYEATITEGETITTLSISDALTFDRHVFLRAGDTIYCYGGWSKDVAYDDTEAVVWLPYLDANTPTSEKDWRGVDVAASGEWEVGVSFDPTRDTDDYVANIVGTTYGLRRIAMKHRCSHVGLRFRSRGGQSVLSAAVIHFDGKKDED